MSNDNTKRRGPDTTPYRETDFANITDIRAKYWQTLAEIRASIHFLTGSNSLLSFVIGWITYYSSSRSEDMIKWVPTIGVIVFSLYASKIPLQQIKDLQAATEKITSLVPNNDANSISTSANELISQNGIFFVLLINILIGWGNFQSLLSTHPQAAWLVLTLMLTQLITTHDILTINREEIRKNILPAFQYMHTSTYLRVDNSSLAPQQEVSPLLLDKILAVVAGKKKA